ncbi:MAG: hypothetical protein K2Q34_07205 [Alphaproteobacteria bacterium]|nr:hypothetical protein [Alphaproteobacteria bacterium]
MIRTIIALVCFLFAAFSMDDSSDPKTNCHYGVVLPPIPGRDLNTERESLQKLNAEKLPLGVLPSVEIKKPTLKSSRVHFLDDMSGNIKPRKIGTMDKLPKLVLQGKGKDKNKENISPLPLLETKSGSPKWASELLSAGKPLVMSPVRFKY